jgi:hypothetical protein
MEDINRLLEGLNLDSNPHQQPEHTMKNCINFVASTEGGNVYAVTNESGTLVCDVTFPENCKVIGWTVLNSEIIVALVDIDTGASFVGTIIENTSPHATYGNFHPIAPVDAGGTPLIDNTELGWSIDHPLDCEARTLINGHRLFYFTDNNTPFGVIDLDAPPVENSVAETVQLTFSQEIPTITVDSIIENVSSTIVPGTYQFVTRYVTSAGNTTTYGIPTQLLPMVPTNRSVGVNNYHGEYASYGTVGKNVKLAISGIDTKYSELEIIVMYYESSTTTFKATVCGRLPVTGSNATFTFTGPITENSLNITKEELRQTPISYTKAKCISQKDNVLFLSNLSTGRADYDDVLQEIANAVEVSYRINELPFSRQTGNFDDYINELECQEKTYRRGEVYSLGFSLLYKDGSRSANYHIPGAVTTTGPTTGKVPHSSWLSFSAVDNSTARLGTFVSAEFYPTDQMYPGDIAGDDTSAVGDTGIERNIRHHYMPELVNEPHFRTSNTGDILVRLLELEFEFTKVIPDYILKDTVEILFTREQRNSSTNKSVLSQGVINHQAIVGTDFDDDGFVTGNLINGYKENYKFIEVPFFNNLNKATYIGTAGAPVGSTSGFPGLGFAFPNYTCANSPGGTYADGKRLNTEIKYNRCIFHSPETELITSNFILDDNEVENATLKSVLTLEGSYGYVTLKREEWDFDVSWKFLDKYLYCDIFGTYNRWTTDTDVDVTIDEARLVDPNINDYPPLDSGVDPYTYTRFNGGGLELKTNNNIPERLGSEFEFKLDYEVGASNDTHFWSAIYNQGDNAAVDTVGNNTKLYRNLFNIVKNNPSQYGTIGANQYILIARKSIKIGEVFISSYTGVRGGDTFISKFAYNDGVLIPYYPFNWHNTQLAISSGCDYYREVGSNYRLSQTSTSRAYWNIDGLTPNGSPGELGRTPGTACGHDLRWTTYFFVESDINTYYRHIPEDETKNKYFPLQPDIATLLGDWKPYLGNYNQLYNDTYSFENNTLTFFTRDSISTILDKFECRTIYSEKAATDDVLDAYRNILVNNYYDIPAHTGPIWDSFVVFNELFLHTPKSLWKTFAQPAATLQGGNLSEVVLGTGSLFARPAVEMLTSKGGYAGTISQWGGVHCPIGYIFPDVLQGKIFGIVVDEGGPSLKDLSQEGISTFTNDTFKKGLIYDINTQVYDYTNVTTNNAHLIDNPFNDIGFVGGYDNALKRFWISKLNGVPFTLSYSLLLNKWFSFHTYQPNVIIPYNNRVFFIKNFSGTDIDSRVYEMNKGAKGANMLTDPSDVDSPYTIDNSLLQIVSAQDIQSAKVFQNLEILSDSYDSTNSIKVRDDNFNTIQVYNNRTNSDVYYLVPSNTFGVEPGAGSCAIKYRNDVYHVAIPRDSVVDNSQNIFNGGNLNNSQLFRERIKGNYAIFVFGYDNSTNLEFYLRQIKIIFNKNTR